MSGRVQMRVSDTVGLLARPVLEDAAAPYGTKKRLGIPLESLLSSSLER